MIYLLRRFIGLYRDRKVDLEIVFIDMKKAYDKALREVLWTCLEKKGVSRMYIQVIKDMYKEGHMSLRIDKPQF